MEVVVVFFTIGRVLWVESVRGKIDLGQGVRKGVFCELLFVSSRLFSIGFSLGTLFLEDVAQGDGYQHCYRDRHAYADPDYFFVDATC